MTEPVIELVLEHHAIRPVLVDIGASAEPPPLWKSLAPYSTYVGFDPDLRDIQDVAQTSFRRAVMINKAVTADAVSEVTFYLTRFPYCSSTLLPDTESLAHFLYAELFTVEREVRVPAITLAEVIEQLELPGVDWLKTDSQGTDLRLYLSLPDAVRRHTLAVNLEPGLIDAYQGEDLFPEVQQTLVQEGFWLADLKVVGTARIQTTSAAWLAAQNPALDYHFLRKRVPTSPGWVEALYLRTVESLEQNQAAPRDYALLWVFAWIACQPGFALDVALRYEQLFGADETSHVMRTCCLDYFVALHRRATARTWKSLIPVPVKNWLKKRLGRR